MDKSNSGNNFYKIVTKRVKIVRDCKINITDGFEMGEMIDVKNNK